MVLRVVVDANILAAALIRPAGWTANELRRGDVEFLAPYTVTDEISRNLLELSAKADLDPDEFQQRMADLVGRLEVLPVEALTPMRDHPLVRRTASIDPDDVPYLACLVAGDADVMWTRDGALLEAFPAVTVEVVPESGPGYRGDGTSTWPA